MECACKTIATCLLCGEQLTIENDNTVFILGDHLMQQHPDIQLVHFDCGIVRDTESDASLTFRNWKAFFMRFFNSNKKGESNFKTTVESWGPSGGKKLTCPKCHTTAMPIIRKRKNKMATNRLGAFCLLSCWPLCFLPMLVSSNAVISVCCRNCGYEFCVCDPKRCKLAHRMPPIDDLQNLSTPCTCGAAHLGASAAKNSSMSKPEEDVGKCSCENKSDTQPETQPENQLESKPENMQSNERQNSDENTKRNSIESKSSLKNSKDRILSNEDKNVKKKVNELHAQKPKDEQGGNKVQYNANKRKYGESNLDRTSNSSKLSIGSKHSSS